MQDHRRVQVPGTEEKGHVRGEREREGEGGREYRQATEERSIEVKGQKQRLLVNTLNNIQCLWMVVIL